MSLGAADTGSGAKLRLGMDDAVVVVLDDEAVNSTPSEIDSEADWLISSSRPKLSSSIESGLEPSSEPEPAGAAVDSAGAADNGAWPPILL